MDKNFHFLFIIVHPTFLKCAIIRKTSPTHVNDFNVLAV